MPLYKGTTEISSNKLYKATTNIENGYKGTNSFYINQVTIQFTSISGLGLTYSTPTTRTGNPGTAYTSTTFTISGTSGQRLTPSSFAMTNLPSSLSASVTSGSGSQTVTVTISGNFPTSSVAPITSVVSGINITTDYLAHFLIVGGGGNAGSAYIASGGGGGGVRTSFSPNGGGQAVDSQPTLTPNTNYTITVAGIGGSSTFNGITATGGANGTGNGASSTNGGDAGAYGFSGGAYGQSLYSAGGGGGAGGAASPSGGSYTGGGNGGAPVVNDITGSNVNYGSGGSGHTGNYGDGSATSSAYGKGGDGSGSGGAGQPGVVILRVLTANLGTITGTHTTSTVGSDTVIQWTGSGTYVA